MNQRGEMRSDLTFTCFLNNFDLAVASLLGFVLFLTENAQHGSMEWTAALPHSLHPASVLPLMPRLIVSVDPA